MTAEATLQAISKPSDKLATVRIRAGQSEAQYWRDFIHYRELLLFLAWRDVLVRYKHAFFGVTWALLRPLLAMLIFTVIFGKLGKFPSDGMPYPLMVILGLLPWQFFASAIIDSSNSLVSNQTLVSKVYFPRLILPLGAITVAVVDLVFSSVIVIALLVYYGVAPTWRLATLPLFFFVALAAAAGTGICLSAVNVKYRDVRFVVPLLLQFGMYLSPVAFSARIVPEKWMLLYSINPMVGVIQGIRWAVMGGQQSPIYWPGFTLGLCLVAIIIAAGLNYFRRVERTLADVI